GGRHARRLRQGFRDRRTDYPVAAGGCRAPVGAARRHGGGAFPAHRLSGGEISGGRWRGGNHRRRANTTTHINLRDAGLVGATGLRGIPSRLLSSIFFTL